MVLAQVLNITVQPGTVPLLCCAAHLSSAQLQLSFFKFGSVQQCSAVCSVQ